MSFTDFKLSVRYYNKVCLTMGKKYYENAGANNTGRSKQFCNNRSWKTINITKRNKTYKELQLE